MYNVTCLNLSILASKISNKNVTIHDYYFGLHHKLRNGPIIFDLLTGKSFRDTALAIHKSGFGSSNLVLFFVLVPLQLGETLYTFEASLKSALVFHEIDFFYVNIVFFTPGLNVFLGYCYYCPKHLRKLTVGPLQHITIELNTLNSNGHARSVYFYSLYHLTHMLTVRDFGACVEIFKNTKAGYKKLVEALRMCDLPEEIPWSPFQGALNISFVVWPIDMPLSEMIESSPPLFFKTGEALATVIPNEYALTRGSVHPFIFKKLAGEIGFCNNYFDPSFIHINLSFLTVVNPQVVLMFIFAAICYMFLWKSVCKGISLLPLILSFSIEVKYQVRSHVWAYILGLSIFGYIYQSFVSSENLCLKG